jgi:hypothetical protein
MTRRRGGIFACRAPRELLLTWAPSPRMQAPLYSSRVPPTLCWPRVSSMERRHEGNLDAESTNESSIVRHALLLPAVRRAAGAAGAGAGHSAAAARLAGLGVARRAAARLPVSGQPDARSDELPVRVAGPAHAGCRQGRRPLQPRCARGCARLDRCARRRPKLAAAGRRQSSAGHRARTRRSADAVVNTGRLSGAGHAAVDVATRATAGARGDRPDHAERGRRCGKPGRAPGRSAHAGRSGQRPACGRRAVAARVSTSARRSAGHAGNPAAMERNR